MELEIPLLALQTALAASVVTAWSIAAGNVHFDPIPTEPETLPTGVTSALPAAWVLVGLTAPIAAEGTQRAAGFGKVSALVPCVIIGRFALPTSGNIATTKYSKVQDFLDLLTLTPTIYAGYRYWEVAVNLAEPPNYIEEFYEISISFNAEVVTDA